MRVDLARVVDVRLVEHRLRRGLLARWSAAQMAKRRVIESRWVPNALARAGQLRPRRPNARAGTTHFLAVERGADGPATEALINVSNNHPTSRNVGECRCLRRF
eukprot:COSAG01_NODE_3393_length_6149_cov_24.742149_4_plen_104_part_00